MEVEPRHVVCWNPVPSPLPGPFQDECVVWTTGGAREVFRGVETGGISFLRIEVLSKELIELMQESAERNPRKRISVGRIVLFLERADGRLLELFFNCVTFNRFDLYVSGEHVAHNENGPLIHLTNYLRESVVIKSLHFNESPIYTIFVRSFETLAMHVHQVGVFALESVNLQMAFENAEVKAMLWRAFETADEVHLVHCFISWEVIAPLLVFFMWSPRLCRLSFTCPPSVFKQITSQAGLSFLPFAGVSFSVVQGLLPDNIVTFNKLD